MAEEPVKPRGHEPNNHPQEPPRKAPNSRIIVVEECDS